MKVIENSNKGKVGISFYRSSSARAEIVSLCIEALRKENLFDEAQLAVIEAWFQGVARKTADFYAENPEKLLTYFPASW